MVDNVTKVCVIGAGGISTVHVPSYAADPRVELAGVSDVDLAAAERMAERGGTRAYHDYHEMLDRERPDAVSICTPPASHREIAEECFGRGLHVLCEKPLAESAAAARAIAGAAERSGVILMPALCHRFEGPVTKARELITRGRLGRIIMYRNRFGGNVPIEGRWRGLKAIAGGGVLLDNGVHSVDLFRYLVGEIAAVSATTATLVQRIEVEDAAAMVVRATGGAIAVIETSWSTPDGVNDIEICGERGTAIVDYDRGLLRYRTADMARWRTVRPQGPDRFALEIGHFVDCVRGEAPLRITAADAVRAQTIIEAAYESAARGAWVETPPPTVT